MGRTYLIVAFPHPPHLHPYRPHLSVAELILRSLIALCLIWSLAVITWSSNAKMNATVRLLEWYTLTPSPSRDYRAFPGSAPLQFYVSCTPQSETTVRCSRQWGS
jgi:hypothetical protein